MNAWLKLLGKTDWKMPDAWTHDRKELLHRVRFGGDAPPTEIVGGDRLVYYAVGWECFFAIAEVISGEPYEPEVTHEWEAQWPWAFDIKIIKPILRTVPPRVVSAFGTWFCTGHADPRKVLRSPFVKPIAEMRPR